MQFGYFQHFSLDNESKPGTESWNNLCCGEAENHWTKLNPVYEGNLFKPQAAARDANMRRVGVKGTAAPGGKN